ncbi:Golgi phosphoprotein 3-domain-containing protein, partial [Mycena sanguinolenta]
NASTINAHAGWAFGNGSRIAVDPRDLALSSSEDALVGGKLPKLTLMEVLLLGIKDKQGYLSFWNDNISYALRGCILIELALRRRIGVVRDPGRKRLPLPDRPITVLSTRQTGETLLDETLKMMKQTEDGGEKLGVGTWVDLLSGACASFSFAFAGSPSSSSRSAKGLVDKGVLRTEKRTFLLFDMATHPVADAHVEAGVVNRVVALLERDECGASRFLRFYASLPRHAFGRLGYEEREAAFGRCLCVLRLESSFSCYPPLAFWIFLSVFLVGGERVLSCRFFWCIWSAVGECKVEGGGAKGQWKWKWERAGWAVREEANGTGEVGAGGGVASGGGGLPAAGGRPPLRAGWCSV